MKKNLPLTLVLIICVLLGIFVYLIYQTQPPSIKTIFYKNKTSKINCAEKGYKEYEFSNDDFRYRFCYLPEWSVVGGLDQNQFPDIYIHNVSGDLSIRLEYTLIRLDEIQAEQYEGYLNDNRNKVLKVIDNDEELFIIIRGSPVEHFVPTIYMDWHKKSMKDGNSYFASTIFDEEEDPKKVLELSESFAVLRETFVEY